MCGFKDNTLLLSVVVPVYNVEDYLEMCIDSIINQTYRNLEIILVDDGSTDNSGLICDQYAENDRRIKVIHKENGGLVSARKAGMRQASGEIFATVDADDWIDSTMFEVLIDKMLSEDADVVQCAFEEEGYRNEVFQIFNYSMQFDENKATYIMNQWLRQEDICVSTQIWNKIYKTKIFKEAYSEVQDYFSYGEDLHFYIRVLKRLNKVVAIKDIFYHYRIRNNSMTNELRGLDCLVKVDNLTNSVYYAIRENYCDISTQILEKWVIQRKNWWLKKQLMCHEVNVPYYRFPTVEILQNKRVIIYGAGKVGRDFIMQLSEYEDIKITKWIDKHFEKYNYSFRKVEAIEKIGEESFDYIIIAVNDIELAGEIKENLVNEFMVQEERILWDYCRIESY